MSSCHISYRRLLFTASLALILLFSLAGPMWAVAVRGDNNVTVAEGEVIDDDLVISANTVVVDGIVNGDLVAVGSQIIINGQVKGSLIFAGQTLVLNGKVGGAVYSGGADLMVGPNANVGRNLFFGGYSFRTELGSVISRDVAVGSYQAVFNGEVQRNLYASLAAMELNGTVGGNVVADVEGPSDTIVPQFWSYFGQQMPPTLQPGLRVGQEAQIGGRFSYISPVEQSGSIYTTPAGGIVYSTPQPATSNSATVSVAPTPDNPVVEWFIVRLREFVTLFLLGALALWLIPVIFDQISERTQTQALAASAWGLMVAIAGYGGAVLFTILLIASVALLSSLTLAGLAASLFGIGFSVLGLVVTLFSMLVAYASKLVVLYPLSHTLVEKMLPQWNNQKIVPLLIGTLAFVLLRSIPWLGFLMSVGVTLVGLGAIWLYFRDRFGRAKVTAPQLVLRPA
jgi:hypothetical protein